MVFAHETRSRQFDLQRLAAYAEVHSAPIVGTKGIVTVTTTELGLLDEAQLTWTGTCESVLQRVSLRDV